MSLYIDILSVSLSQKPSRDICLLIESSSATLKTDSVSPTKSPFWKDSLICSSREQYLSFKIVYADSMDILDSVNVFAMGDIYFYGTSVFADSNSIIPIQVKLMGKNSHQMGTIQLSIDYDKSRNYLGEMEFFQIQTIDTQKNMLQSQLNNYNFNGQQKQDVKLYKGACLNKNLFSCMDRSVENQKFTWIEKKYRFH